MNGLFESGMPMAASVPIALAIAGAILSIGYALGAYIADRGVELPRRLTAAGLAAAIGIALCAPGFARADHAYDRAMEEAGTWDYAEAASWLHVAAERGDERAQERVGLMLVHGEGLYGAALGSDPAEGLEWLERAAARGSDVARFVLTRAYGAPETLAASR
ncbi:MAG: hypothetical protein MUC55_03960 [Burkholderiales bacterium]|jgi:TPR repeat protein|nr:hypothetical protein [Burkholderiales bacterium]